jgi:hypothetical protein
MAKNTDHVEVTVEQAVHALFGTQEVEVKGRLGAPGFKGPVSAFAVAGIAAAVKAGVSDLLNGQAVAALTKPSKDDFSSDEEFKNALSEYEAEKAARKSAMWHGLHTGEIPTFSEKSWVSPLRQEIDRIVYSDLSKYFAGHTVRESAPKSVYAIPARTSKEYAVLAEKWLNKYSEAIKAEAAENVANGIKSDAVAKADAATLEF